MGCPASISARRPCVAMVRAESRGRPSASAISDPSRLSPGYDVGNASRRMVRNLLSLPRRRLIRSTNQLLDTRRSFVGGENRHEGRRGNFHDYHALFGHCPAYIGGPAVDELRTHPDPANWCFCFNPGPRWLVMTQNWRILSKRSGDDTNNDRETNRHISRCMAESRLHAGNRQTESGPHQADTYRRPSVCSGVTRVLPACTGQAGCS